MKNRRRKGRKRIMEKKIRRMNDAKEEERMNEIEKEREEKKE